MLVSCEMAIFCLYSLVTRLSFAVAEKVLVLLAVRPSFHEYVRWRVTCVSDSCSTKKRKSSLPSSAMLQDLSHMDRITQLQDEIQRVRYKRDPVA